MHDKPNDDFRFNLESKSTDSIRAMLIERLQEEINFLQSTTISLREYTYSIDADGVENRRV